MVCVLALAFAPTVAHAADTWSDPSPGIRRLHRTLSNQNLNVLVVDLCAPGVSVRATASGERQRTVSSFGALACTPGHDLYQEDQPGRRELANAGRPVVRW